MPKNLRKNGKTVLKKLLDKQQSGAPIIALFSTIVFALCCCSFIVVALLCVALFCFAFFVFPFVCMCVFEFLFCLSVCVCVCLGTVVVFFHSFVFALLFCNCVQLSHTGKRMHAKFLCPTSSLILCFSLLPLSTYLF